MESALYDIYVPQHFPWSILYLTSLKFLNFSLKNFEITHKDTENYHLKNISKNIISPHNLELVKKQVDVWLLEFYI